MKNLLLSLILLISNLVIVNAQCEIDNPSFEDWGDVLFEGTGIIPTDIFMPDSITTPVRFIFWVFESASVINPILTSDPQGFIGLDQSTDATEGDFAVELQANYGSINPAADIFSLQECFVVPDSFAVDIKHVGEGSNDRLQIYLMFSDTLQSLPYGPGDLVEFPSSGYRSIFKNTESPYERFTIPIKENFPADVNSFYYDIVAQTSDSTAFLVDNLELIYNDPSPTLDQEILSSIKILQNPVNERLRVSVSEEIKKSIVVSIVDLNGRIHLKKTLDALHDFDLDVSNYSKGSYFLQFLSKEGIATLKFIKM